MLTSIFHIASMRKAYDSYIFGAKRKSYEKLPEGLYLAASDEIQGLVAQGRTIWETLEIARDVEQKLLEAQEERESPN